MNSGWDVEEGAATLLRGERAKVRVRAEPRSLARGWDSGCYSPMFLSRVKTECPSRGLLWGHFVESKRRMVVVRARYTAHRARGGGAPSGMGARRYPRPGEIVEKRSGGLGTDSKSVRAGILGAQEVAEGGGAGEGAVALVAG